MSYSRWSKDSDVYVFRTSKGYECCGCGTFKTYKELIEHLKEHKERGDKIYDYLLEEETYEEE